VLRDKRSVGISESTMPSQSNKAVIANMPTFGNPDLFQANLDVEEDEEVGEDPM